MEWFRRINLYERTAIRRRGTNLDGNIPGTISFADLCFSSSQSSVFSATPQRGRQQDSFLQNGAGFGDVGVEGFDDGGVLLFHDAALEFEGEGKTAVVESKILGEKRKALDGFVLREMNGESFDLRVD